MWGLLLLRSRFITLETADIPEGNKKHSEACSHSHNFLDMSCSGFESLVSLLIKDSLEMYIKIEDNYFGKILDDSVSGNNPIE